MGRGRLRARAWGAGAALALVTVLLLPGCGQFVDTVPAEPSTGEHAVYGAHEVGQTLVCHHAGLVAVSVMLRASAPGPVTLVLRESVDAPDELARVRVEVAPGPQAVYQTFPVPLQRDVNGRSLYVSLQAPRRAWDDAVIVPYRVVDRPGHTVYLDGQGTLGNIAFRLHYRSVEIARDVLRRASRYAGAAFWRLFVAALLFVLPGCAAVTWLLREGDWIERLVLATGVSVALNGLLVYATLAGLRLSRGVVVAYVVLSAGLIALRAWRERRHLAVWWRETVASVPVRLRRDPAPLALALVLGAVIAVRIYVIPN